MFKEAADKGFASAQYDLGLYYQNGLGGCAKDLDAAAALFEQAAKQNHLAAQYELGMYYLKRPGKEAQSQAIKWLERAANSRHPDACYRLWVLTKNREWLKQAADGGHPKACQAIGRLTPGQSISPNAGKLGERYLVILSLVRAAKDGDKEAQIQLAAEWQGSGSEVLRTLEDSTQEPETLYQVAAADGNVAATQCLLRLRRKAGARPQRRKDA